MDYERMIFENDSALSRAVDERLRMLNSEFTAKLGGGAITTYTAHYEGWCITVDSSAKNEIFCITTSRGPEESYIFLRDDEEGWQACGSVNLYEDAHFMNAVRLISKEKIEWKSRRFFS